VNIIYPRIAWKRLPTMLGIAFTGAILAGTYGALHDQISYTISPEYFTKLKFIQFSYADFGWPPRVFASEVGFLASFWVGLFGGWFLARVGLDTVSGDVRRKRIAISFGIVLLITAVSGAIGAALGIYFARHGNLIGWQKWKDVFEINDLSSFVIVAYLHYGSYLGALVGIIAAIAYVRKRASRDNAAAKATSHPAE